ncbi:hypothetical protein MNBD_GAMMA22-2892 [hydrothermal vent metagenome]|uniref:HipA-like C-terminal domain-containing protein n=1 Tax=hydrothermal vent metagenome TaxID=652676 RepID=A0A3B1ANA2_9ZZZZ
MADKHAVIWTNVTGSPLKMGDLIVTHEQTRFSYHEEFLAQNNPNGLSLLSSPQLFASDPVVFYAKDLLPMHPRLISLIPGNGRNNIQRRIYTRVLDNNEYDIAAGFDTDWELLLLAGHNGIGHIDIFRDDRIAEKWYESKTEHVEIIGKRSNFWQSVKQDIQEISAKDSQVYELESEDIVELLGPTPSVGGMIPKLLVAIPDKPEWNGSFAVPGTKQVDQQKYVDVLLKIEPREYRGVSALEACCLQWHKKLNFDVPRYWRTTLDGMNLLAVERFDRNPDGTPIPMESFFSVFASGDKNFQETADTDMQEIGDRITKLASVVNMDTNSIRQQIYKRFVLAFFTGNGDMHLENLSFLGGPNNVELAPVYDPAPMRAWVQHNTRSAIPINFDNEIGGVVDNLIAVGTSFGFNLNEAKEQFYFYEHATRKYTDSIMALEDVPLQRRQNLYDILKQERKVLKLHV